MRLVTFFTVLCSLTPLPGQDRPGWEMTDAELAVAANQIRAGKSLLPESWPGGARVAVLLSFDVDNDTSRLASGRPPSIGAMSQGEYGARVGLKRVVELIDRYEIPATFFTPAVSLLLRPDMIDVIQASGRHEFGVHGWIHEQNSGLPPVLERQLVERAIHYLEEATGERPVGYRAPSWNFSPNTLGIIREMGLMYDSSLMADDAPYEILANGSPTGIVELPVEWILDDAPLMNPRGQSYTSPRELLRAQAKRAARRSRASNLMRKRSAQRGEAERRLAGGLCPPIPSNTRARSCQRPSRADGDSCTPPRHRNTAGSGSSRCRRSPRRWGSPG